jgi:hypothetical protein
MKSITLEREAPERAPGSSDGAASTPGNGQQPQPPGGTRHPQT